MLRITFSLIILFILLITFSCKKPANRTIEKPNIILIMADDLGYECLGCNGGESYFTPNLDLMAAEGIRYTSCFSQPLCTPSRVQIMTGKYNDRNYTDFGILKLGERTFAHFFHEAGYVTAVVGKWQLYGSTSAGNLKGTGTFPTDAGFDEYCLWQIDLVGSRYADPVIHVNYEISDTLRGEYGPDVFYQYIRKFIEANKERPFLLYYPMVLPHDPHVPTPNSHEWDSLKNEKDDRFFSDMVSYTDYSVGRIINLLDEFDLRSNTLLIFTSDNGTNRRITSLQQDNEIPGEKGYPTYYGTHVPLIVQAGDLVAKGKVKNDLVDFSDILPTLCDWAGINPGEYPTDGVSFVPTFFGEKGEREWIYCFYHSGKQNFPQIEFIQDKHYKLYNDKRFYDLVSDPEEDFILGIDSLKDPEHQAYLKLRGLLNRRLDMKFE